MLCLVHKRGNTIPPGKQMKKLVTREQLRQFIKEEGLSSAADVQAMLAEPFGETLLATASLPQA